MNQDISIATLRESVQGHLAAKLAARDPLQPFVESEIDAIKQFARSRLGDDLAQIGQKMSAVHAEAQDAEAVIAGLELSARLRRFIDFTYERGSPPWIRLRD